MAPRTQAFDSPEDARANAKRLLEAGEITQKDYDRVAEETKPRGPNLSKLSDEALMTLRDKIDEELQSREQDKADNKPMSEMSHQEYDNHMRRKGYA